MGERFDEVVFVAILVTAIIMIVGAGLNPLVVKVFTDLVAAYCAVRVARNRSRNSGEIAR